MNKDRDWFSSPRERIDEEIERDKLKDLELKAKQAHQIWSHWMKYMLKNKLDWFSSLNRDDASRLDPEDVSRWERLMNTEYEDLTEEEKESDRKVANLYLK